jgi:hypothetical protein
VKYKDYSVNIEIGKPIPNPDTVYEIYDDKKEVLRKYKILKISYLHWNDDGSLFMDFRGAEITEDNK